MKHPVPKHKKSRARTSRRHAAFLRSARGKLLDRAQIIPCKKCGASRVNHTACPACGEYNGRTVKVKA